MAGNSSSRRPHEAARKKDDDVAEETLFEMSAGSTFAALIFFLVAIGACIATTYILIRRPTCLRGMTSTAAAVSSSIDGALLDTEQPRLRDSSIDITVAAIATTSMSQGTAGLGTSLTPNPSLGNQGDAAMPPICSNAVASAVKKQLRPDECTNGRPWRQNCSWTKATRGCHFPNWMAEHYAKEVTWTEAVPFVALHVSWPRFLDRNGHIIRDLQLGAHTVTKYDVKKFIQLSGGGGGQCPIQDVTFSGSTTPHVKVVVLDADESKVQELNKIKGQMGLGAELVVEQKDFTIDAATDTIDVYVRNKLPGGGPIHHMSISQEGWDYELLMGASSTLSRVRYLDFDTNWKSEWSKNSLSTLIRKLKTRGFVCYWTGSTSGEIWRITDCWLVHYGQKNWGRIGCVNAHHADVTAMLDRMESLFLETTKKEIEY